MKFSERLKELRSEKGISQMELSKLTGISQSSIGRWELGRSEPTASSLIKLAEFFGESVEYLLGITD
ncbi:MAG: helix-turn-helix domain-containing protein [Clostridia bacterium]|nr:helix-turn-helix domain-containing protein [Clostridia bacterium]